MLHTPPCVLHSFLSPSRAHEKGSKGVLASGSGMQVAIVKASTSFRTKILGKVPPRLLTLFEELVSILEEERKDEGSSYVASKVI